MLRKVFCWMKNRVEKKELPLPQNPWLVRVIELQDGTVAVEDFEFRDMEHLSHVILPGSSLIRIGTRAFENTPQLLEISYYSIAADWYALVANSPADCFAGSSIKTVHCLDMDVALEPSSEA